MKTTLETRLGMFAVLVAIAAFLLLELGGGFHWFQPGITVRARFNAIQDLKVGDPVKLAGVPIGRVTSIQLAADKVEVACRINRDAQVRTDTTASIRFTGLLGQNHVALDFGSPTAPVVAHDALLQSREQPDLGTLMDKLQDVAQGVQSLTKSFSGQELSKLLGPAAEILKDNQARINAILSNTHAVTVQVASGKGTVGRLLYDETLHQNALGLSTNLNELSTDAKRLLADSRSLVADARKITTSVDKGEGSVGRLLRDDTLAKDLTAASTALKEILQKINSGQGSVGKLVNDESFLRNVKMTLQKVDKATEGLEDTGPLQVIGTAVQTLF